MFAHGSCDPPMRNRRPARVSLHFLYAIQNLDSILPREGRFKNHCETARAAVFAETAVDAAPPKVFRS